MVLVLSAAAMGLAEMLQHFDQYLVPEYQRVYGWGETEIKRLVSDVERAMRPDAPRFYLGTVYLAAAHGERRAQIADGQQRLLTVMIAYAVARDLAESKAAADRLHALVAAPGEAGFRFVPRDRDAQFLREWVQERGATLRPFPPASGNGEAEASEDLETTLSESQQNIIANRDLLSQTLRTLGEAGREKLFTFLEQQSSVVAITAPTLDDARNAYASTQSRGLRQAETDKLKAELIGDCPFALRSRLACHWEECEATLGKEDLAELLQQMIVVRTERKPQYAIEVDLFRAFNLPQEAERFIVGDLVPSARAYRRLTDLSVTGHRAARRIGGHLVTLQRTTHSHWKAPALQALLQYEKDPAALEAILRGLERLAAALMIRGTDPNLMLDRYIGVIRGMKASAADALAVLDLKGNERADAVRGLGESRFGMRERFRMPLLLKLNDLLAGDVQPIDPKTVSCEHILPRNVPAASPYRQAFRSADKRRYDGRRYVNLLGNLTLLDHGDNQRADTHPYEVKRAIFKRSPYALANEAAKYKTWTPDVVRDRTDRLVKMLSEHWRL